MCVCVFVFCFISASDFAFFVLFLPRSFTINNTLLDASSVTRSLSRCCSWFQFSARVSEKTGSCVSRFKYRSLCAHAVPVALVAGGGVALYFTIAVVSPSFPCRCSEPCVLLLFDTIARGKVVCDEQHIKHANKACRRGAARKRDSRKNEELKSARSRFVLEGFLLRL